MRKYDKSCKVSTRPSRVRLCNTAKNNLQMWIVFCHVTKLRSCRQLIPPPYCGTHISPTNNNKPTQASKGCCSSCLNFRMDFCKTMREVCNRPKTSKTENKIEEKSRHCVIAEEELKMQHFGFQNSEQLCFSTEATWKVFKFYLHHVFDIVFVWMLLVGSELKPRIFRPKSRLHVTRSRLQKCFCLKTKGWYFANFDKIWSVSRKVRNWDVPLWRNVSISEWKHVKIKEIYNFHQLPPVL